MIYRQGDILLRSVDSVPEGVEVKRINRKLVIALGEVTGHSHVVATLGIKMIEVADIRYLIADRSFALTHEEHATVKLPEGYYRITRQRQYHPAAVRTVAD